MSRPLLCNIVLLDYNDVLCTWKLVKRVDFMASVLTTIKRGIHVVLETVCLVIKIKSAFNITYFR